MENPLEALKRLIGPHSNLVVLTGAGVSVKSGIPPYRDHGGNWLGSQPIQHQEFIEQKSRRKRYWARSAVGWPAVAEAQPNDAHRALAGMEQAGVISLLVTQNVDRLHQRAGHRNVVDLHGRLDRVNCLACNAVYERSELQLEILQANPFLADLQALIAPDGDAVVPDSVVDSVSVPECRACGGTLMPDVVFFGGAVPAARVIQVTRAIETCDALMTIGSSLMVYSGFRFCRQAHALGKPLIAVNQGKTRADDLISVKIEQDCAATLTAIASHFSDCVSG